jgi:O-acetyl-ADP-ribose deacetylase (regulator of RNase III)/transcriptional regulator with XRE-family HTH domain
MPFTIVRQDITKMTVDAIVNAANNRPCDGRRRMRRNLQGCRCAGAAGCLQSSRAHQDRRGGDYTFLCASCKYVIHAVGPVYRHWNAQQSEALLRSAYTESLRLASKNHIQSIAFPLISSGIFGYPKDEALKVASSAITDYLQSSDMDVFLAVFDKTAFAVSEKLLGEIESYIDEHYVEEHRIRRRDLLDVEREALSDDAIINYNAPMPSMAAPAAAGTGIDELVGNLDEPFGKTLLRLIDTKGKTDVEVYKRANIDRKLFSKIRTGKGYMPGKRTILALAIALELTLDETDDLLERAGFALSHSQKFDVIVEYFIVSGRFDIFEINEVLFKYDQPLLGG